MNLSKSIDFLLTNAGPVIQYRLRKEILRDLTPTDKENLLEQVYQTSLFKLLESYVKPNGYIGSGMHSWDNWRGTVLHRTPLEDGETAVRLLSYYAIPKAHPIVVNYVAAMRNEDALRHEFSYIPPEVERYNDRFIGMCSGFSLMILVYTMQAMLGFGDDTDAVKGFQDVCLSGFKRILELSSVSDITKTRQSKSKHNKRYSPKNIEYPTAYIDVRLEPDYKRKYALECDLTFWAVQFLTLVEGANRQ